jgi:hypothetical protein
VGEGSPENALAFGMYVKGFLGGILGLLFILQWQGVVDVLGFL